MRYKKFAGGITVLSLCFALAPITKVGASEKSVAIVTPNIPSNFAGANAFNLSNLARSGYLEGIPSGSQLSWELATGRITAHDIVKAGVQAKQVSSDALNNPAYIRAIELNLAEPRISD